MKKIIFILIILILSFFIFSQNKIPIYNIIEDFDLFFEGNFVVFYSIFRDKPEKYNIFGYYPSYKQLVNFIRSNEFCRSKYFSDRKFEKFSYFSTFEGNDVLWIKDVKEEVGYRLVFNISGYLKKVHFSENDLFVVLSFLYLDPTYYIYIAGINEDYIYPVAFFPNIIEIFSNQNYIYILNKENELYKIIKIVPLNYEQVRKKQKPEINYILKNIKKIIFYNNSFIFFEDEESKLYLFDVRNEKLLNFKNYKIIKNFNINDVDILIVDNFLIYNDNIFILNEYDLKLFYNFSYYFIDFPMILFDNSYIFKIEDDLNNKNKIVKLVKDLRELLKSKNYIGLNIDDFQNQKIFIVSLSKNNIYNKNTLLIFLENLKAENISLNHKVLLLKFENFEIKEINDEKINEFFSKIYSIKKIKTSKDFIYILAYKNENFGISSSLFAINIDNFNIDLIFDYSKIDNKYLKYYKKE